MPRFPVSPEKQLQLEQRMERLGIREEELNESFIRGTGSGGQKINKTSSSVLLVHPPSGIEVRCQSERSQGMNRFLARRMLCEKLEEQTLGIMSAAKRAQHKARKQKARRSKRAKAKLVEGKRLRAKVKTWRQKVGGE